MAIQSKEAIKASIIESAVAMQKVRQRKETERTVEALQEAEPRTPPQVDLSRR